MDAPSRLATAVGPTEAGRRLLAAIIDDPFDDEPRRVYADLLMEHGDPRGEFIEVQCSIAREGHRAELVARQDQLFAEHRDAFSAFARPAARWWVFHRGFIETVLASAEPFHLAGPALFEHEPVTDLSIEGATAATVDLILTHEILGRLEKLRLEGPLSGAGLARMAAAPGLREVTELALPRSSIGALELETLLRSPYLELRALRLDGNSLGSAGARLLGQWLRKGPIEVLSLARVGLGDDAVRTLLGAMPASVRRLSLASNPITAASADAFVALAHRCPRLTLDVRATGLGGVPSFDRTWSGRLDHTS